MVPIVEWDSYCRAPALPQEERSQRTEALRTLLHWSPCYDEVRLLSELRKLRPHGTAVMIYNLWQSEQGGDESMMRM